jgi:hypothetical protein
VTIALFRMTALTLLLTILPGECLHAQAPSERIIDLPMRGGVYQRVLLASPARPKAVIVMLPGGSGDVGLTLYGGAHHGDNFVVRTRELWTAQRLLLAPLADIDDGAATIAPACSNVAAPVRESCRRVGPSSRCSTMPKRPSKVTSPNTPALGGRRQGHKSGCGPKADI